MKHRILFYFTQHEDPAFMVVLSEESELKLKLLGIKNTFDDELIKELEEKYPELPEVYSSFKKITLDREKQEILENFESHLQDKTRLLIEMEEF